MKRLQERGLEESDWERRSIDLSDEGYGGDIKGDSHVLYRYIKERG